MTLREQIAAASAKATGGVWECDPLNLGLLGDISTADRSQCVAQAQQVTGDDRKQSQRQANADLIVALVNAYRQGKLLVIEDEQDAVDKLGFSIWHQLGQIEENARAGQLTQDEVRTIATAALAALRGDSAAEMARKGELPDE